MGALASQIISLAMFYSTVYSDTYQRKHHSSASLAFVRAIRRSPAQKASDAENVSIWWRHHGVLAAITPYILNLPPSKALQLYRKHEHVSGLSIHSAIVLCIPLTQHAWSEIIVTLQIISLRDILWSK